MTSRYNKSVFKVCLQKRFPAEIAEMIMKEIREPGLLTQLDIPYHKGDLFDPSANDVDWKFPKLYYVCLQFVKASLCKRPYSVLPYKFTVSWRLGRFGEVDQAILCIQKDIGPVELQIFMLRDLVEDRWITKITKATYREE
jgi:hypothetical protein